MKALWHLAFWPLLALGLFFWVLVFVSAFFSDLCTSAADHCEKKLRAHRGRA